MSPDYTAWFNIIGGDVLSKLEPTDRVLTAQQQK